MESPEQLFNKKATINLQNEGDNRCLQYSITLALNYNKIKKKNDLENILKLKWGNIDFSSHQKHWEKFEQNNTSVTLNVLFVSHKNEEIKITYKQKYNNMRKNQVVFLMVNDKAKRCYYFDVKNLLELYSS